MFFVNISNIPIKVERTKMFGFKCTKMCPPWQIIHFLQQQKSEIFWKRRFIFLELASFQKKNLFPE